MNFDIVAFKYFSFKSMATTTNCIKIAVILPISKVLCILLFRVSRFIWVQIKYEIVCLKHKSHFIFIYFILLLIDMYIVYIMSTMKVRIINKNNLISFRWNIFYVNKYVKRPEILQFNLIWIEFISIAFFLHICCICLSYAWSKMFGSMYTSRLNWRSRS